MVSLIAYNSDYAQFVIYFQAVKSRNGQLIVSAMLLYGAKRMRGIIGLACILSFIQIGKMPLVLLTTIYR